MVNVRSLLIALFASQATTATAIAGERMTLPEPAAASAQKDAGQSKDARIKAAAPLDRVATAVEGAESSHGKDIGMWLRILGEVARESVMISPTIPI